MDVFIAVPIGILLFALCRACYLLHEKQLRLQFYIWDLWAAAFGLVPSMHFISKAYSNSTDRGILLLAIVTAPCQVLGICCARVFHRLNEHKRGSCEFVLLGAALGLAVAMMALGSFELYQFLIIPGGWLPSCFRAE